METTVVALSEVSIFALLEPSGYSHHVSAPLLNVYSMIVSMTWSILCQISFRLTLVYHFRERKDVPSKASSTLMEVVTHSGRYADIDRTGHAESEGEDVLRIVLMKLL